MRPTARTFMSTAKGFFGRWKKPLIVATVLVSILLVPYGVWYSHTDLSQAAAVTRQKVIL